MSDGFNCLSYNITKQNSHCPTILLNKRLNSIHKKNRSLVMSKRLFDQNILRIKLAHFCLKLMHYLQHQLVLVAGFVRKLDQSSQAQAITAGSYHALRCR